MEQTQFDTFNAIMRVDPTHNYDGFNLYYNDRRFQHPHSPVGHQGFERTDFFNLLRSCKNKPEITISGTEAVWTLAVTAEELDKAGVRWLLARERGWATSTHQFDTNPNFELVTTIEMLECLSEFVSGEKSVTN